MKIITGIVIVGFLFFGLLGGLEIWDAVTCCDAHMQHEGACPEVNAELGEVCWYSLAMSSISSAPHIYLISLLLVLASCWCLFLREGENNMKDEMFKWVESFWGTRCPDYVADCPCCEAWKAYDYLFQWECDDQTAICLKGETK